MILLCFILLFLVKVHLVEVWLLLYNEELKLLLKILVQVNFLLFFGIVFVQFFDFVFIVLLSGNFLFHSHLLVLCHVNDHAFLGLLAIFFL